MVWLFSLHELKKEEMGVRGVGGTLFMKQGGSEPMQNSDAPMLCSPALSSMGRISTQKTAARQTALHTRVAWRLFKESKSPDKASPKLLGNDFWNEIKNQCFSLFLMLPPPPPNKFSSCWRLPITVSPEN